MDAEYSFGSPLKRAVWKTAESDRLILKFVFKELRFGAA
jgi:hypothetical protein